MPTPISRRSLVLAVPLAAAWAAASTGGASAVTRARTTAWQEGEVRGPWQLVYHGYGRVNDGPDRVTMVPAAATRPEDTHACLVASTARYGHTIDLTSYVRTDTQVRTGSDPNPWETAWLLWHYTDDLHFYALALKPNGWELSKEDPAYPGAQRFLTTGTTPRFPIGSTSRVRVRQSGATIRVDVDGRRLTTFTDRERPYTSGRVGLYTEDAAVAFGTVRMFGRPLASA